MPTCRKKDLTAGFMPEPGAECIRFRGVSGVSGQWATGSRLVDAAGVVTYADADGKPVVAPSAFEFCDSGECAAPTPMAICGPIELSGMADLIKALTDSPDVVLTCGADGFIAVNGTPSTVPCGVAVTYTFESVTDADGNITVTATASDGSTTTTLEFPAPPEDVDKVYTGYTLVDGILTQSYVGSNGDPLPDEVQDLTALVSDDFDPVAAATALCGSPAATAILKACVDTTVTYTFPSVTDADGNVAVTPTGSDGSTGTPIVIPAPVVDTDTDTYIGPYVIDPETGIGVAPILNADGTDLMS